MLLVPWDIPCASDRVCEPSYGCWVRELTAEEAATIRGGGQFGAACSKWICHTDTPCDESCTREADPCPDDLARIVIDINGFLTCDGSGSACSAHWLQACYGAFWCDCPLELVPAPCRIPDGASPFAVVAAWRCD